ncbi:dihydroorotate dehydrogenase electron transfer subunit [Paenibacillus crassostreae]|uniref:Dihydroorotate dehydrogenase electron transfer subunit n=1 Tax=Paenibacillus crassostreae TaxID=1763538 RepID=A0A167DU19_9BACL|nr:dihydroorotate dehydrogenase electron transfer subunit [Paenibacillus crassostreae]AOZ91063.1 dihydroorotate dehydrogenase electron transfer subunit [Paenibacillus crassostreae]OAB74775.1 dihydroorotate dehydrogenase electron transfer subunit [Paenibacillus crassostreae]
MGKVISNTQVSDQVYLMSVEGHAGGRTGQFYMLRAWGDYPILSRPISIFNISGDSIDFLYQVVGEGTELFARLRPGDPISLEGPFGNGFPDVYGRVALVGGGIGIAPLYYCAQQLPNADIYLGFSKEAYLLEPFNQVAGKLMTNVGGFIIDDIDFNQYDAILACGPHGMMKAIQRKQQQSQCTAEVYISLENRMACGIGACLVCSVSCHDGRKKACTDGPVFAAEEVLLHD